MSSVSSEARSGVGVWVVTGALAGLAAGVVFLVFEMVAAGLMGASPFGPTLMIGATVLREGALPPQPGLGLALVLPVALVVHFALSAVYGAVFGALAGSVEALRSSTGTLVAAASVFGLALWLVNFYVISPVAFPWFGMASPVVQFLAHTFFFGSVLGLLFAQRSRAG